MGYDAAEHKNLREIPDAVVDLAVAGENIFIPNAAWGVYRVLAAGTDRIPGDCVVFSVDPEARASVISLKALPVLPGQHYSFTLGFEPGSLKLSGGFAPSRRKGLKAPALLSYATPTTHAYVLPRGVRLAPLVIFYGEEMDPASFSAAVNGRTVTGRFHPKAGGWEVVRVPVVPGKNTLELSARGAGKSRGEAAADKFEITVPEK